MTGFSPNSSVPERLAALKALRDVTNTDCFAQILKACGTTSEEMELDRGLAGLTQEDEFAVLSVLMDSVTHLVPLTTRRLIDKKAQIPDLLARFHVGCSSAGIPKAESIPFRCLVEVKSQPEPPFVFKGGALARLRHFADSFGLPLIFAVRFTRFPRHAIWVVVEDVEPESSKVIVDAAHLMKGIKHVLWDDRGYFVPPHVSLRLVYDKAMPTDGIRDQDHGWLQELALVVGDKEHILSSPAREVTLGFLEAYRLVESAPRAEGTRTTVRLRPQIPIAFLSDIVYQFNNLTSNPSGAKVFDAARLLAESGGTATPLLITRQLIEDIAEMLAQRDALFFAGFGEKGRHEADWRRLMGKSQPVKQT